MNWMRSGLTRSGVRRVSLSSISVDNRLKDHQGLVPNPAQYPESWYINHLNRTIKPHVTLYQYVVNHQMQADSIAKHLGTASVTSLSYESYVETIRTFCQTIDHTNHKAVQENSRCKALQAKFNGGCNGNRGGRSGGRGRNSGRGGRRQPNQIGHGRVKYHNWIPKDQFDNLDEEGYQCLIQDHISRGEIQANTSDMNPAPSTAPTNANPAAPPTQIQVSGATGTPETQSVLTGAPPSVVPPTSWSVSMALVTPSRSSHGSTTATQMESGPNTLLRQLMSNASAWFATPTTSSYANDTVTTTFNGGNYQIHRMNYAYCYTQHALHHEYQGALVDSGTNGGMAGSNTCILAMVPHAFVDITGVETIHSFCQTIDHTNHKAVQEKSCHKALQAKFNGGCNGNRGGRSGGRGRNSGRGGGHQPNQTGHGRGKYHNWIPKGQFDNLDEEGHQCLIRDRISHGEIQANTSDMNPAPSTAPTNTNPVVPPTQIQVSGDTGAPETQSVLTGAPPSVVPPTSRSVSMALL